MGLWDSFRAALGLDPAPRVRPPPPLVLTHAAIARLGVLPDGHGIRVATLAGRPTHTVTIDELVVDGPFPDALDGLPVDVAPDLLHRLAGLELDHAAGHWRLGLQLTLRARETPNPNGRVYEADRPLADGRRLFPHADPSTPPLPALLLARDDVRVVMLRDATLTVERTPDAPWDPIDRAVGAAVRAQLLGGHGVVEAAPAPTDDDPLMARVRRVLADDVRPALHRDGGDLELVAIEDGIVIVRLIGACRACPASTLTLHAAVASTLTARFPGEVLKVEAVD